MSDVTQIRTRFMVRLPFSHTVMVSVPGGLLPESPGVVLM